MPTPGSLDQNAIRVKRSIVEFVMLNGMNKIIKPYNITVIMKTKGHISIIILIQLCLIFPLRTPLIVWFLRESI